MVDIAIIEGQAGASVTSADVAEVISLLRGNGVVCFKGFGCDTDGFAELTRLYSNRHTCDPSKVTDTRLQTMPGRAGDLGRLAARVVSKGSAAVGVQQSDDGTRVAPVDGYGINPHNENTFIPGAAPDLVWFLCVRAAIDGGSTVLCDGPALWAALSERARDFAASMLLHYELTLERAQWQAVYDVVEVEQLLQRIESIEGASFDLGRSDALHFVFDTSQLGATFFHDDATLNSNALSRRPHGKIGEVELERLASGGLMPAWFVQEFLDVVADHQVVLDLEPTDLVMIDNTRVMHGRTAFSDLRRRVLTRCSWLDPAVVSGAL